MAETAGQWSGQSAHGEILQGLVWATRDFHPIPHQPGLEERHGFFGRLLGISMMTNPRSALSCHKAIQRMARFYETLG